MDGSLLDDEKQIHDDFWPLLDELARRGILLCPASGRQYATLRRQFGRDELVYIAENGAYVVQHDEQISADALDLGTARTVVETVRGDATTSTSAPSCAASARPTSSGPTTRSSTRPRPYYARLEVVDDLLDRRRRGPQGRRLRLRARPRRAPVRCCSGSTPWCPASTGST